MSFETMLRETAVQVADLETGRSETEHSGVRAAAIKNRVASYQPVMGVDYQCPRCWVLRGAAEPLFTVRILSHEDVYACSACSTEYVAQT